MKHKLNYSRTQIYQNCLYAMCIHIAAIPRLWEVSHERSWDEISYSFQSYKSTCGTISFDQQSDILVGAFRKNDCVWLDGYPQKNALTFFLDSDESVCKLAQKETLQYLLITYEKKEKKNLFFTKTKKLDIPVITTAFWSEGDDIYSSDDENSFIENGGDYINDICIPKKDLVEILTDDYELTPIELSFAENLYNLKNNNQTEISRDLFSKIANMEPEGYEAFLSALSDFHFKVI